MKFRMGFVSNSSSSSFLISYPKENLTAICPTCGCRINDVSTIIDMLKENSKRSYYDDDCYFDEMNSLEECNAWLDNWMGDWPGEKEMTAYKQVEEIWNSGVQNIASIKLSNHNHFAHNLIHNTEGITIIYADAD